MHKILFVGAVFLEGNNFGGETLKNKIFLNYLKRTVPTEQIKIIDTFRWQSKILPIFFKLLASIFSSKYKSIIVSSGSRGTSIFLRLYNLINFNKDRIIHMFVLGGAFPQMVRNGKYKLNSYRHIDYFYTETESAKKELEQLGFINVTHIPNWKDYSYYPEQKNNSDGGPLRLFTFSRINKVKGTDLVFKAVQKVNDGNIKVTVDFYGLVDEDYSKEFYAQIDSKEYFNYKGTINLFEVAGYKKLSNYDAMLFPTFHPGEGFAGTIIDCFIAGVPVLASDWNYNSDVIDHGRTGYLFEPKDVKALHDQILYIIDNNELGKMRLNCVEEAKNYKVDRLLNDFQSKLKKEIKE